jgi:hypothetical protein
MELLHSKMSKISVASCCTYSLTQQGEQPATSNTHAHRGKHILRTKATIQKHNSFLVYNFKRPMTIILVETCSENF